MIHFPKRAGLLLLLSTIAGSLLAEETTVLIEETFSGSSIAPLSGRTPSVHAWSAEASWTADTIFAANGQVNDGTNTDRGAWLDLGPDFAFQPNQTYTLELSWSNLDNAILFAGFAASPLNTGIQAQTQGTNFALRARRIAAGTDTLASWKNPGASAVTGTIATPSSGTATLTLDTASLNNASFVVSGLSSPVAVDLTAGYRYLWIAYEDPTAASPASDARLTSLTLTGPAPIPQPDPPTVAISPASHLIEIGQIVTLTATPPEAEIRFTLDGSTPDASSSLYTGPFPLNASATLRALAILNGVSGPVSSQSYVLRQSIGTPNVVIIIGENVGFGDLQCYGGVNIATPSLDSLAYDGIRFTQFTTTGPGAAASQYALLTGRVAARSGLGSSVSAGASGIRSEEWTLAELLRRRGYETAFVGEWLLGDAPGSHPRDQGFRLFYGLPFAFPENPPLVEDHQVLETTPNASQLLEQLTARSTRFIQESSSPFALIYQIPSLPASGTSLAGPHGNRIEAIDRAVGGLLDALETRGIADQTLVVFASDSGAPRTADGGSNGLLRDGKGTTWEGGMRTPMLARLPDTLPAGQMNLSLLWLPDLMPTLASLLDGSLALDRPLDGTPRPDVLTGSRTRPAGDEKAFGFRFENGSWKLAAVRQGKWKSHLSILNLDPLNTKPSTGSQLYDLHVDAEEYINRSGQEPAILNQLQNLADSFSAGLPAAGITDLPAPKPAVRGEISKTFDSTSAVDFSFTRPVDSLHDHYLIEHSGDLSLWLQLPIDDFVLSVTPAAGDNEDVHIRVPFGIAPFTGDRRFVRLTASRPANP